MERWLATCEVSARLAITVRPLLSDRFARVRSKAPKVLQISLTHQPYDLEGNVDRLGDRLVSTLNSGLYDQFIVRVAFATRSGTSRIFEALQTFNENEGTTEIVVGINNGVTTAQALEQMLLSGCSVYTLESNSTLFHPKVYLLNGQNRAWCSIGSSNLTGDGLFRNLETNVVCEFDPISETQERELDHLRSWPTFLQSIGADLLAISVTDLEPLISQGRLMDERVRKITITTSTPISASSGRKLTVPPMPPPATVTGSTLLGPGIHGATRRRAKRAAKASSIPSTAPTTRPSTPRYFAMTLSAFDCSHKSGTLGTPEISIPERAVSFFPQVKMQGRMYPDAYFEVLLNEATTTRRITYRIWQRPPGSGAGHADWRINIKHETMDLTSAAGGDVILFERDFDDDAVPYKVWIVDPSDIRYRSLLASCTEETHAKGAAGLKKYGVFA